jgi:hypothetical protein
MLTYALYAERFGWTPEQVDQLTVEQDDWLMPIAAALDSERERREKKAVDDAERKAKAKKNQGN